MSEPKGMSVSETFEWLRKRSNRLDAVLAENKRLLAENIELQIELARINTKPVRDALLEAEYVGDVMDMRLRDKK